MVSIRQAARELGVHPKILRGACAGMEIGLTRTPPKTLLLRRSDLERIRRRLRNAEPAIAVAG